MTYSETRPLNGRSHERHGHPHDLDAAYFGDQAPAAAPHFKSRTTEFGNTRPSIGRRMMRSIARFCFAALFGIMGTLAWQSFGDELLDVARTSAPSVAWFLPASATELPAPAATSADLQQQFKPVLVELAVIRRSIEQLAANQDQNVRKQDEIAQSLARMQSVEQDMDQKISLLPQRTVRAPASKPVQSPPAQ